mmetsp:Transcript_19930/g.37799  ORF Transcript_19930/g.37799 Transcript_19930/m.37799 type:complete len:249 (-) Transcript_19930:85-831(-)
MSNVHGLHDEKSDDEEDHENDRYVGGIGERGGGSGLAVMPNNDDVDEGAARDRVFGMAQNASADESGQVRRTITMYRDGFVVDDGPYRRLDDPANGDFLRAIAMGRTPRELIPEEGGGDVTVGLVDKRNEDYVETFRSFSGAGTTLGAPSAASAGGTFDPATLPSPPPAVDAGRPSTSIAVRLLNGKRQVVKVNLDATVNDLAAHLVPHAESNSFRMVAGFPPKPLTDPSATIEAAGLKGAQVSMQKA